MTTFDSLLGHVRDAASDYFGDEDTDEVFEMAEGLFGGSRGDSGDGGGGFDWGEALSSVFGGSGGDREGGGDRADGGGDGWDFFGQVVERLSGGGDNTGDNDGDNTGDFVSRGIAAFLPDEVRGMADDLLGPEAATWVARLVDPGATEAPGSWAAPLTDAVRGLGLGLGDESATVSRLFGDTPFLRDLAGGDGPVAPGHPAGELDSGLGGEGPDSPLGYVAPAPAPGPDPYDEPAPEAPAARLVSYDELVTSGTSGPGYEAPGHGAVDPPHDPTFPADPDPAPPVDDFHQSIDAADQAGESLGAVFEGP